jgi:hypothetical protein
MHDCQFRLVIDVRFARMKVVTTVNVVSMLAASRVSWSSDCVLLQLGMLPLQPTMRLRYRHWISSIVWMLIY